MHLELFNALENENPRYSGFYDAIDTNPATVEISKWIKQIKDALASDVSDEKKKKLCRHYIGQFDNKTKFKNDYHAPPEYELARSSVDMMKKRIKEEKAKLAEEPSNSDATAAICIDRCALDAIEKQTWGSEVLRELISPKEEEKRVLGRHGMASRFRMVPNTGGRICFIISRSLCPILGQSNVRHYSDKTRINGVFDYVSLLGIHESAGLISSEHAKKCHRICLSLLITWEGVRGNFEHKQVIETSMLNRGIIQFLPSGFNQGRYVMPGTVALSDLLSPNGINEYFVALMLVRLEMDQFAQLIRLLSNREFNQEDLRGFMEGLLEERKGVVLGKYKLKKKRIKRIDLTGVPWKKPIPKYHISQYKGVSIWKTGDKIWKSRIYIGGKNRHIGTYDTELEAAVNYARALFKYEGKEFRSGERIDVSDVPWKEPIYKSDTTLNTKYKGIHFSKWKKQWHAKIYIKGEKYHIGYYHEQEDAGVDYARALFKYGGTEE